MANKKVSQLTSKPSVLVTDLFPIADPSTGQLYKTTISDLGTAIGSGVSSVNGLVGAVVLDTDDIQELVSPTNKWFTDTRARAAISAGTGISYNSGTGVITNAVTSGQIATALGYTPADDSLVVKLAGTQTITGAKAFSANLTAGASAFFNTGILLKDGATSVAAGHFGISSLSSTTLGFNSSGGRAFDLIMPTSGGAITVPNGSGTLALTSDLSVYALDSTVVHNTGNESISGVKTFTTQLATAQLRFSESGGFGNVSGYTQIGGTADYFNFVNGGNTKQATFNYGTGGSGYTYTLPNSNGTLALTSQLSSYLPLSGGTLTGALSGTSATFSGAAISLSPTTFAIGSSTATDSNSATFQSADNNYLLRFKNAGGTSLGGFYYDGTNFIADQQNWKFGSRVGVGNMLYVASTSSINAPSSGKSIEMVYRTDSGNDYAFIQAYDRTNSVFKRLDLNSAVTILASGNVGIGTTSPQHLLQVVGGSNTTVLKISSSDQQSGTLALGDASGTGMSVGVWRGTASTLSIGNWLNLGGYDGMAFTTGNAAIGSQTERMRITSGGNVLMNQTSVVGAETLNLTGLTTGGGGQYGIFISMNPNAYTCYAMRFFNSNSSSVVGSITVGAATTSYNITSDYRLKEDLRTINGLEIVNKIKVYDYKWKSSNERMDGVMAHELAEVLPYAVHGVKDGEQMQAVDYSKIVPVMVQAIKDLKAELDTLKNK